MTKRCALLSTDNLEDFFVYDEMLIPYFKEHGWVAEEVSWRNPQIDWDQYDVVIVRSTWDYQDDPEQFIAVLQIIENSSAVLENSFKLLTWNISKEYLKEIEAKQSPIVPSRWMNHFDYDYIANSFDFFATPELIVKPTVSANSDNTFRLTPQQLLAQKEQLSDIFSNRPHIIQPFISAIIGEGEYSLFYFGGEYSHCILKIPKEQDFRVQEEHGGRLKTVTPELQLQQAAQVTLATLPGHPLYARLDYVRSDKEFVLMEVELIEPSLYFNMDAASPKRFTDAFIQRHGEG